MSNISVRSLFIPVLFASAAILLSGCGQSGVGGGASTTPSTPAPPTSTNPTWTANVFNDSSQYKDRCAVVRTGLDIEGNPYPDRQGSIAEENFWLRSWTNETYLWNDEVIDRNPNNYNNPLDYFALLKTEATTVSGKPKDEFHYTESTEDFLAQRNAAPISGYGATLIAYRTTPPRDIRVLYNEPGSPASDQIMGLENLPRGARIYEVDGVDLINANTQAQVNILNDGLFPLTDGETHTFRIQDPIGSGYRTVMVTSEDVAEKAVNRTAVLDTPTGKVGYILLNTFRPYASEIELANAITAMKTAGVVDLVVDLRYNSGGLLAIAAQLGYMIAGDAPTNGKDFERFRFNDDAGIYDPVIGDVNLPFPFFDTGLGFSLPDGSPLDSLNLNRVYLLTTDWTCSASEAVINGLLGVDFEVVLIGSRTCGKPYGFYPTDNCGVTYNSIQFQGVNDKGFGDYADGFIAMTSSASFGVRVPGCAIGDDLSVELGDENEALLEAALYYRENASCPPGAPVVATAGLAAAEVRMMSAGEAPPSPFALKVSRANDRDLRMPK